MHLQVLKCRIGCYYLDTRKAEGFNTIQINILRQWDSSKPLAGREPFAIKEHEDGHMSMTSLK